MVVICFGSWIFFRSEPYTIYSSTVLWAITSGAMHELAADPDLFIIFIIDIN